MRGGSERFGVSVGVMWTREVRVRRGVREQGVNKQICEGLSDFNTRQEWRWEECNSMREVIGSERLVAVFFQVWKAGTVTDGRQWEEVLNDTPEFRSGNRSFLWKTQGQK